jgi:hypothetical protein
MDFSGVRLHTDHRADALNRDLQAGRSRRGRIFFSGRGSIGRGQRRGCGCWGMSWGMWGSRGEGG